MLTRSITSTYKEFNLTNTPIVFKLLKYGESDANIFVNCLLNNLHYARPKLACREFGADPQKKREEHEARTRTARAQQSQDENETAMLLL